MTIVNLRLPTFLTIVLLVVVACRQQRITPAEIQLELTVSDMLVGETTLLVSVKDRDGNAIANPGRLSVRGDMSHAGMVPVFAEADDANDGVFALPFTWTMGGDWIVEASLKLPNGDTAVESFTFEIRAKADEDDISNMDHRSMEHAPGEASAVYMRITNSGASDHVIVSAESAAAGQIEFHQTVVENDVARMEALEALVIPAGEFLELRPGGPHIMLSELASDLRLESAFSLQLKSSAGAVYEMDARIFNMLMDELDDALSYGDLVFSNRWARPAKAGGAAQADMPMKSNEDAASG